MYWFGRGTPLDTILKQTCTGLLSELGVRRVLNGSGTWTKFGSSVVSPEIAASAAQALQRAFVIDELQDAASRLISDASGAEAGCIMNCSAAGLCVTSAAVIAGTDLAKIYRLPFPDWPKREILIQKAHAVDFGAQVTQMVRLSGAEIVEAGSSNSCDPDSLAAHISPRTAGAVFVISHHCPQHDVVPLPQFASIMKTAGVPVIVDAAAEFDIHSMHDAGADLVIQSAQKFPGGPTAGIISGRAPLITAVRAQSVGIGRAMKASKEAIVGAMIALSGLMSRDNEAVRERDVERLEQAQLRLAGMDGIATSLDADPTGIPVTRLRISVDPRSAGVSASQLTSLLLAHDPVVATRDSTAELGYFLIDPRSLSDAELFELCDIVRDLIQRSSGSVP